MRTSPSTKSSPISEPSNAGLSYTRTSRPKNTSSSSSTGPESRHFTPRKRSNIPSFRIPRSTHGQHGSEYTSYGKYQHSHQDMQRYIPTIPPYATLPDLEGHRIHLLDQLQATDFESTTILRSLHATQTQLDYSLPLPSHDIKALRRNMKIQRWALWKSEEKEMDILVRLGEVALRMQRNGRWEKVCWEAQQGVRHGFTADENWRVKPPAMYEQADNAQNVQRVLSYRRALVPPNIGASDTQSESTNSTPRQKGALVPVDAIYHPQNLVEQLDPSPCAGQPAHLSIALEAMDWQQQAHHLALLAFAWQQPTNFGGNDWNYYENTSHVNSTATTCRNTAIGSIPQPVVPYNSRHGSLADPGQSISGSDLSQKIEQAVGSERFRKSEPAFVGRYSAEEQSREHC